MKVSDDQATFERVQVLEDALAELLDRDGKMHVSYTDTPGERCVWVPSGNWGDEYTGYNLYDMARELEVILS